LAKVSITELCNRPQTLIPTLVNAPDNLLSRDLRIEMWLALAARLRDGEALYSNAQFRDTMLEI